MQRGRETLDDVGTDATLDAGDAVPGLVMLFAGQAPCCTVLRLEAGALELGRDTPGLPDDERLSRRHVRIAWDGEAFRVADLGSRNGTFSDGERITGGVRRDRGLVRAGHTLALLVADVRGFEREPVAIQDGVVIGPATAAAWREVTRAARSEMHVLLTGESGVGKELAAHAYHAASPTPDAPLVAVNCATIPAGVAERLLFGTRRGAYSGAEADADGFVQSAHGGTLFLDEIGELDLGVQAKLLRVLETGEVFALGAARPRKVDFRVCSATLRDLAEEVAAGRFRQDLYYRIGRPVVRLAPLRDRVEEIAFVIARALTTIGPRLRPLASLVEACVLRPWPGNLRELLTEIRRAGQVALEAGRDGVEAADLAAGAGLQLGTPATAAAAPEPADDRAIEAALAEAQGNVTAAARRLGMHRNQLRRWLSRREK